MTNRRSNYLIWATAVLILLPMVYVASFGPACWLLSHHWIQHKTAHRFYRPITIHISAFSESKAICAGAEWWATLWGGRIGYRNLRILEDRLIPSDPIRNAEVARSIGGGARLVKPPAKTPDAPGANLEVR